MDNQHKLISGYRDLNQGEIDAINDMKSVEKKLNSIIEDFQQSDSYDKRTLAIAKTHLETGFMFLIKSIAKPTS